VVERLRLQWEAAEAAVVAVAVEEAWQWQCVTFTCRLRSLAHTPGGRGVLCLDLHYPKDPLFECAVCRLVSRPTATSASPPSSEAHCKFITSEAY
jgi:hypothetical protein